MTALGDRITAQAEEVDSRYHLAAGIRRQINKVFPTHWSFMLGEIALYSFVILLISGVLRQFESIKIVNYAFQGIRAGVLALILKAMFSMYDQCPKSLVAYVLIFLSFLAVAFLNINAVYVIIACALIGLAASWNAERRNQA